MLVGGGAGILRAHQGGRVPAGEERVPGTGRSGASTCSFALLLFFAFLFLPILWMEVGIWRN